MRLCQRLIVDLPWCSYVCNKRIVVSKEVLPMSQQFRELRKMKEKIVLISKPPQTLFFFPYPKLVINMDNFGKGKAKLKEEEEYASHYLQGKYFSSKDIYGDAEIKKKAFANNMNTEKGGLISKYPQEISTDAWNNIDSSMEISDDAWNDGPSARKRAKYEGEPSNRRR